MNTTRKTCTALGAATLGVVLFTGAPASAGCNQWEFTQPWGIIGHPSPDYEEYCATSNGTGYDSGLTYYALDYLTQGRTVIDGYFSAGTFGGNNHGYFYGTDLLCADNTYAFGPPNGPFFAVDSNSSNVFFSCAGHGNGQVTTVWGAGYLCTGKVGPGTC